MISLCQQIKIDCEQLQALKEEFFLEYEKAKETRNLVKARVLKNRWEKKYDLLRKKLGEFFSGEVFDFIMELREKTNEDIHDADDIHFQPDGTLAGRVQVGEIWYPFQGNELIKTIGNETIENSANIHTRPDGTLAGRVQVDGKWYPFQGNELIKTIGNEAIESSDNIHTQPDGTLAGLVKIGGKVYPFQGNELIKTIGNEAIEYSSNIRTQPDGTLAGRVQIGGIWRDFLRVNDEKYILF